MKNPLILAACCACAVLALSAAPALADDGSATIGAGGLVLQKTDKIALVSEDLYLSTRAVRISYRFRNLTDQDYTTIVAFPMPDLPDDGEDVGIPDPNHANFLKFQTFVDGKPVISQIEKRAILMTKDDHAVDITDKLRALHIPLSATSAEITRLTKTQRQALIKASIIDDEGTPQWKLRSKFWRTQVFPKGKEITVQQNYVPIVGDTFFGLGSQGNDDISDYKDFCVDDAFLRSARALYQTTKGMVIQQDLSCIITSGGTWAGPIGDFRLTVNKGDPKALVSFCGTGIKKISPTRFQMEIRQYTPDRDIHVLFLMPRKSAN